MNLNKYAAINETYVFVFNEINEWEWYDDSAVRSVAMAILEEASLQQTSIPANQIPKGAACLSYEELARKAGLKDARRAVKKLVDSGDLTVGPSLYGREKKLFQTSCWVDGIEVVPNGGRVH